MESMETEETNPNKSFSESVIGVVEKYSKKVQMVLENCTGIKLYFENDLLNSLRNGVILCRFIHIMFPDKFCQYSEVDSNTTHTENLNLFLNAVQTIIDSTVPIFLINDFNEPKTKPNQSEDEYVTLKLQKYLNVLTGLSKFVQFLEETNHLNMNEIENNSKVTNYDDETPKSAKIKSSNCKTPVEVKFSVVQFKEVSDQLEEISFINSCEKTQYMNSDNAAEGFKPSKAQISIFRIPNNDYSSTEPSNTSSTAIGSKELVSAFSEDTSNAENMNDFTMNNSEDSLNPDKLPNTNSTISCVSTVNNNTNNHRLHVRPHSHCTTSLHCTQALSHQHHYNYSHSHDNPNLRHSSNCQWSYQNRSLANDTILKSNTSVTSVVPNLSTLNVSTIPGTEWSYQNEIKSKKEKCISYYHDQDKTHLKTAYNKSQCTTSSTKISGPPEINKVGEICKVIPKPRKRRSLYQNTSTILGSRFVSQNSHNYLNDHNNTTKLDYSYNNDIDMDQIPHQQMSQSNVSQIQSLKSQEPEEAYQFKQMNETNKKQHLKKESSYEVYNEEIQNQNMRGGPHGTQITFKPVLDSEGGHYFKGNEHDNVVGNIANNAYDSWSSLHSAQSFELKKKSIKDYGASLADAHSLIYSETDNTNLESNNNDWISIQLSSNIVDLTPKEQLKNDIYNLRNQQKEKDHKLKKKPRTKRTFSKEKQPVSANEKRHSSKIEKTNNTLNVSVDTSETQNKRYENMSSVVYLPFQDLQPQDKKKIQLIIGTPQKTNVSKGIIRTNVNLKVFRN